MIGKRQPDYEKIGKAIKKKREEKGYTQEKLAELTGLSVAHISNVKNAHTKVSLATLILIANELDSSLDELTKSSLNVYKLPDDCKYSEIRKAAIIEDVILVLEKSLNSNLDI